MANNTQLNPGSGGDTIATDDIAGVKYQRVKLVDGTEDSAAGIAGDATFGLDVDVTRLPSLPPGGNTIGGVTVVGTPSSAADGGALPAVQEVVAGFDGVNVQVVKTDSAGVLQVQPAAVVPVSDNGGSLTVDGTVSVSSAGDVASSLSNGRKTVAVAGTAVALGPSGACAWVTVTALPTNTGLVHVGGSGVLATPGSETGVPLAARESVTVPVTNVASVFVDARVAGEGVTYLAGVL